MLEDAVFFVPWSPVVWNDRKLMFGLVTSVWLKCHWHKAKALAGFNTVKIVSLCHFLSSQKRKLRTSDFIQPVWSAKSRLWPVWDFAAQYWCFWSEASDRLWYFLCWYLICLIPWQVSCKRISSIRYLTHSKFRVLSKKNISETAHKPSCSKTQTYTVNMMWSTCKRSGPFINQRGVQSCGLVGCW